MKRSVISLIIIGLHLILLTVLLRLPVAAENGQQTIPLADSTATPVTMPLQISVRQQVPLAFTMQNVLSAGSSVTTDTLTTTAALTETIAVTLDLQFDLTLTNTLTATVPSTVVITFGGAQTTTIPVSLTVALTPTASVIITPLLPITVTDELSTTADVTSTAGITEVVPLTPTLGITTNVPPQVLNPTVVSSVAVTTNLRSGPDTTFDIQTIIGAGQSIVVVAQNADGTWYLLNNGLWLASFLVDNPPATLPLATEELVTTLREQNPITPTVPVNITPPITATVPITGGVTTDDVASDDTGSDDGADGGAAILVPTPTPNLPAVDDSAVVTGTDTTGDDTESGTDAGTTETPEAAPAEPPSVTVDANLRSGPGTTFEIIGGTVTGQALTIIARNEDSSWFQLDNGGWLAAFLIANAPDPATVPLFDENAPPVEAPVATTPLTPTVPLTPTFGVQENLYAIRVDGIVDRYDFALTQVESLIATAQDDPTQLENQEWIIQMTTMITLLRSASDELQSLTAPALFTDAQEALSRAAEAYGDLATILAGAIDSLSVEGLTDATAQIAVGNQLLGAALDEVERLTP